MGNLIRIASLLVVILFTANRAETQDVDPKVTAKLKTVCQSFINAWWERDFASATERTIDDFFYCHGEMPVKPESADARFHYLRELRDLSTVGKTKSITITHWVNIKPVSELPIEKMRLSTEAKALTREWTKPDDISLGVVFENPMTSKRDVLLLLCRKLDGKHKIVGVFYSEPKNQKRR